MHRPQTFTFSANILQHDFCCGGVLLFSSGVSKMVIVKKFHKMHGSPYRKFSLLLQTIQNTAAVALSELKGIYTNHLLPLIRQFRDWGQRQSPTFKYWNMFLSY
jgi:hypothetical protein